MAVQFRVIGISGIPEVVPGMDLVPVILEATEAQGTPVEDGDILVVTQKIVSKSEGKLVDLATVEPSHLAKQWAQAYDRDPRMIELALRDSRRISRMDRGVLVTETHHGFYCVNSGVDASNVPGEGMVTLLPEDPDASARRIRDGVHERTGLTVAVIITDTWGRPWREGLTNVAIGVTGMDALKDYRGQQDRYGHELHATAIAVVDEVASAAELVMGKVDQIPAAIIRGYTYSPAEGTVRDLVREPDLDIYR